jgi:hypothetical protein
MNGWVLIAIGLASLGLAGVAFAYVGYTAYRLVKAGLHLARTYGPPAAELAGKVAAATERAAQAGANAEDVMASLGRLQVSLQRLQIVAEAFRGALAPYQRIRSYFGK